MTVIFKKISEIEVESTRLDSHYNQWNRKGSIFFAYWVKHQCGHIGCIQYAILRLIETIVDHNFFQGLTTLKCILA